MTIKQNIWSLKLRNIDRLNNRVITEEKLARPTLLHNACVVTAVKWIRVLYNRNEVIPMCGVRL